MSSSYAGNMPRYSTTFVHVVACVCVCVCVCVHVEMDKRAREGASERGGSVRESTCTVCPHGTTRESSHLVKTNQIPLYTCVPYV